MIDLLTGLESNLTRTENLLMQCQVQAYLTIYLPTQCRTSLLMNHPDLIVFSTEPTRCKT